MCVTDIQKMCMWKLKDDKIVFDKSAAFLTYYSHFLDHCNAYLVSFVFHFSLDGRTMALIVTVP